MQNIARKDGHHVGEGHAQSQGAERQDQLLVESLREVMKRAPMRLQTTIAEGVLSDAALQSAAMDAFLLKIVLVLACVMLALTVAITVDAVRRWCQILLGPATTSASPTSSRPAATCS